MSVSLLQFAREFQKLKADVAGFNAPDSKLLCLVAFWQKLKPFKGNLSYQTYFEEYVHFFLILIPRADLSDLSIEELSAIKQTLKELPADANAHEAIRKVTLELAKVFFYVGEIKQAIEQLTDITDKSEIAKIKLEDINGQNEFELFHQLVEQAHVKALQLYKLLLPLLIGWEKIIESIEFEGVRCLYVEKDTVGHILRGRMKILTGKVELAGKSNATDDIAFDNKVVAPDDPFIGVSYTALKAVRTMLEKSHSGIRKRANHSYHAHFEVQNSSQTFTGDSIGLAIALLSYICLLKNEISRQDKYLAADVAVTGSIDDDGAILPVADKTLCAKITRAFFSPVKYLVIPEQNAKKAQECLDELSKDYPRRRLLLVTGKRLNDILEDHNVIRSERVCLGNYVTRKVVHYSRAAKIQIPLLAGLLWVLLAVLFPRHFNPWFDWHIDHIEIVGNRFKTVNPDGYTLWWSERFASDLNSERYATSLGNYLAIDVDEDGRDELIFAPCFNRKGEVDSIQFYDSNGKVLWQKPAFLRTSYPGDAAYEGIVENCLYRSSYILPFTDGNGNTFIVVGEFVSFPARSQVLCYDLKGNLVSGPYLYTGALGRYSALRLHNSFYKDVDAIAFHGTNNRYSGSGLLLLDPKNLYGVSPPYDNELFRLSGMPKGSQLIYVNFPESPLSAVANEVRNEIVHFYHNQTANSYNVRVKEGINISTNDELKTNRDILPTIYYYLDSNFIPEGIFFADGTQLLMNALLISNKKKPITDFEKLGESLKSEVVVYYGDSIVHHLAAGIDFYKNEKK